MKGLNMWLTSVEIATQYDLSENAIRNFIASGRIQSEDIQYRPLSVYMTPYNCRLFSELKDSKTECHEKRELSWNISSYQCYISNYNCDDCLYSKLESLKRCNMPNVVNELLLKIGEPPKPNIKEFEKMMTIRNNFINP